ncbi:MULTISPECIES: FGGY-family carbohydrate kinase [unclassified Geobacillus]|uniref:FGGY-family carbohydrate kinase n=1 Tax=unclassified Geobacillus TaxID=2642459 RepID=UPI0010102A32|nr:MULTISPECIES: FGGY-family carbohydrate kinase [unclassified Geobacillus]MCG6796562.1 hypothetical protein [Geobacillus sp. YHL]RXS86497.1 carbohydrate kinase [Geobacillus sp. PK12]
MSRSSANPMVLVLDMGTTGGRAIVFDANGQVHGSAYREYRSVFHSPTVIDHDPETWLQAIKEVINELKQTKPECLANVLGLAVTSQRATILPVDKNGTPLAPAILWQDKRSIKECKEIEERLGHDTIYQRTGLKIDPYFSLPKILWFRNEKPEIYHNAAYFLTAHDYIVHSLTGEFKTDWTQASRTMLFNIHRFQWDDEIIRELALDENKLPRAFPTGTIAGRITKRAASEFGLPEGLPVVMAGGDQQCAAVGLGAVQPGIVKVTTGTGSFVVAPIDHPATSSKHKVVCSASAIPGHWVMEAGIFTTGSTYRWLRDLLSSDDKNSTLGSYDALNHQVELSKPGANGVLHVPHYAGSAAPYWNAKASGVLFNLSLGIKKSDVIRAFLEGICFEINKNLKIIDSMLKENSDQNHAGLTQVHVSGGLVRLDLFNQIQADIYGLNVIPGTTEQASALGAAMIAFVALKVFGDVTEASKTMGSLDFGRMKMPNPEMREIYQEMSELHDAIYQALLKANIYERSSKIIEKLNKKYGKETIPM